MLIKVNIDHKEGTAIIEKKNTNSFSMVKNILSKRESHISKSNINVS